MTGGTISADVIVVGSGFGGSVAATRIAEAGISVTLLERGPWRDTVPVRSMGIDKRTPLPRGGKLFTRLLRAVNRPGLPGGGANLNNKGLFELFFDRRVNTVCSSGVGGGSHVYSASHLRPLADKYWDGHDDTVSTQNMEQHYEAVFARMESALPTAEHRIPNTMRERFQDSEYLEAATPPPDARSGYLLAVDPDTPKKVVSKDGVERWEFDLQKGEGGFLGSPDGSKTTLDFIYLAPAIKAGLKVRDLCEVKSITRQDGAAPRFRVDFIDHHTGGEAAIEADNVIMAAGTMNTLRILFNSRDGVGGLEGMPNLGKRFGTNGDLFAFWDYNEPGSDLSKGLPTTGMLKLREDGADAPMIGGGPVPSIDSFPLPGFIKNRMKRGTFIAGLGEDAMDGTVTFKKGKLKIYYDPDNSAIFGRIRSVFDRITEKTGRKIYTTKKPWTVHPTGGCCFAGSIDAGVVNADGEVFDNPGLYVADAAALPRPPGGPPSMTIAAWSDRLATRFIERHKPEAA